MFELRLDHIGIAVNDLERGRAAFARLGFRLTARSLHSGSPAPGAPVIPWGSGNHCAMLRSGYLEVIGLTDPALFSSVKAMVADYEGLHIIALGCSDADATYRALAAAGIPADPPRALERDAAFGENDQAVRRARFRNIYLDRGRYPEGRFLYIEHLTRDVLWQPHLLDHANGAVALDEVYFCAPDPRATATKIGNAVGVAPASRERDEQLLRLARGRLKVFSPEAWAAKSGGKAPSRLPAPVGLGVRVKSIQLARELLAQRGVKMTERAGLWVEPAEACGATVRFFEENEA